MKALKSKRQGARWGKRNRCLALAASAAVPFAATVPFLINTRVRAAAGDLYWDINAATLGAGSATPSQTWSGTTTFWSSSSTGNVATSTWTAGSGTNAHFSAGTNATGSYTVALADNENVSVVTLEDGALTIGTTGASGWALNFGANAPTFNITGTGKNLIWAPITANAGLDTTFNFSGGNATLLLAGDTLNNNNYLTGVSGNFIANNNNATKNAANMPQWAFAEAPATATQIIKADQFIQILGDNQQNNNGHQTLLNYAIPNPIVLNYNGITPASGHSVDAIGVGNGSSGTARFGDATFIAGVERFLTYSGVISSNAGISGTAITDLYIQGSRGATVLANSANSYNGDTIVNMGGNGAQGTIAGNGLLVMGVDNALPTTGVLYFGASGSSGTIAPMDLNGHNIQIAGLGTLTSNTASNGSGVHNGNIYNTSTTTGNGGAAAAITIAGTTNTTYAGDIGDTNLDVNPYNDQSPYVTGKASDSSATRVVTTNTNVSLVLNGPGALTLAPPANQQSGNEYSGTTTINNTGVLVLGRVNSYAQPNPNSVYTVTGTGNCIVNTGGTLASIAPSGTTNSVLNTSANQYAGGFAGNVTLMSGASLNPGGNGATGTLSTNSMTINAGATLNMDFGAASSLFDLVYTNSGITLDPAGTSTVKLGFANGVRFVTPGSYTLVNAAGGITPGAGFFLDKSAMPAAETFTGTLSSNSYQVVVTASVVQWDPSNQGTTPVAEASGTWTNGSSVFVDYAHNPTQPYTWSNTDARDVLIGNDPLGGFGSNSIITLGSNIVAGKIYFGVESNQPNSNYIVTDGGSGNTLTINGGISVNNAGAVGANIAAEIDAPIVLGAEQTWNIDAGEFLLIKGAVTGNKNLTISGASGGSTIWFHDAAPAAGALSSLTVTGGFVLMSHVDGSNNIDSIGTTAPITLNGGAMQWRPESPSNATLLNPLNVGVNGGSIGATSGVLTVNAAVNGPTGNLTVLGTGGTKFASSVSLNNLTVTATGDSTFAGNVTTAAAVSVASTAGTVSFGGNITAVSFAKTNAGTVTLSGANSFSGTAPNTVSVAGGTLVAASSGALGSSSTSVTLATTGNLFMNNLTSLPNPLVASGTGSTSGVTVTGNVTGSGGLIISGAWTGGANIVLAGPEFTFTSTNTGPVGGSSFHLGTPGMIVHTNNTGALGTSSLPFSADVTLDTQSLLKVKSLRAETSAHTLTKTGAGMLEVTGNGSSDSIAGSGLVIKQGIVQMDDINSIGTTAVHPMNIAVDGTLDGSSQLSINYVTTATRTGGSMTVNNGKIVRLDYGPSNTDFIATSGTAGYNDVWTFQGNSAFIDNDSDVSSTGSTIGITNRVVVASGATLTLQMTGNGGANPPIFPTVHSIDFRGPTSTVQYAQFLIQAGATVKQLSSGEVRFGRIGAQGIPIIGQGTPGSESLFQMSSDCDLTDVNSGASPQIITKLIVNGSDASDTSGLRIEAAMNANYLSSPTSSQSIGTTGLFGQNTNSSATSLGSPFTVLSVNRAHALSDSFNDGTTTFAQQGTLTLAANDTAASTDNSANPIVAGPSSASNVTLALDNTAANPNSNLTYYVDGLASNNTFQNFKGLTIQQTNAGTGTVKAALASTTKIQAITFNNGTHLDVKKKALVVEAQSGGLTAVQTLVNNGSIMSSDPDLQTPMGGLSPAVLITDSASNAFGLSGAQTTLLRGQTVDASSVLVAFTYRGDANLDGKINADDYFIIDSSYSKGLTGASFYQGDFTGDGVVNGDDYFQIDNNFLSGRGAQTAPPLEGASSLAGVSAVPEPAMLGLCAMALPLLGRRRRKSR